tara:strand:+ start:434 stop:760 length:327 start_codon:yes stop_codon:yes gene_type:complete
MAQLSTKVKTYVEAAGKTVDFTSNVSLQDDGNGSYIKEWNINGLAKPTEEQLNALEAQANTLEASNQVIANRKAEYPSIEELVVALYDTEDKLVIENKRKAIKDKYPK